MYDNVNFDGESGAVREVHPAGLVKAVAVDIIDMPHQENNFYDPEKPNSKQFVDQVRIVWETMKRRSDGRPFTIKRTFSKSLYDGSAGGAASALYKMLSCWFGADFTGRFEAKKIIDKPAVLVIRHETKDGIVRAKLESVLPDDGVAYSAEGSYKRWVPKGEKEEEVPF